MQDIFLKKFSDRPEYVSEEAFLQYIGVGSAELSKIWWYRERMYSQFEIPKGKGKIRTIFSPNERLKFIQYRILGLLESIYRVRKPVHGFVKGRSVKTNALEHLGKTFLLNIDLNDFFPSIEEVRIVGLLISLGFDKRVSKIISRLCCFNWHLPQGAPTSPIISNMICFKLDKELMNFAKNCRCIYTRYADDISFSSYRPMGAFFDGSPPPAGKFSPDILNMEFRALISGNGFSINSKKTHYADRHSRKIVTGLKVNKFVNVDRKYIRNIRATLFYVEKFGISDAQFKYQSKFGGKSNIESYIRGKIVWLSHVRGPSDPVFRSIALRFNKLFADKKIELLPTAAEVRERAVWVVDYCQDDEEGVKADQGTAFFLKNVGLITAAHCVEGVEDVEVYHPSKPTNKFPAKVGRRHLDRDLAIINHDIPLTEFYELEISGRAVSVGNNVVAVGYPNYQLGDRMNIRAGDVSSFPVNHAIKYIEVTQTILPGMSGGPLLDDWDLVIGVIHKGGGGAGERNKAVHIDVLKEWLSEQ